MEPLYRIERITNYHHTKTRTSASLHLKERASIMHLLHPELASEEDVRILTTTINRMRENLVHAAETGAVFVIQEVGSMDIVGIATLVSVKTIRNGHTGMIKELALDASCDQLALAETIMRPLIEHAKAIGMRWILAEPHELYQHQTYDNFGFIAEDEKRMRLNLEE